MLFRYVITALKGQLFSLWLQIWIISGLCIEFFSRIHANVQKHNIFSDLDIYRNCSSYFNVHFKSLHNSKPYEACEQYEVTFK
jgi:hypothetical protein